jgi:nucleotide-binding universal stress UspA family protein
MVEDVNEGLLTKANSVLEEAAILRSAASVAHETLSALGNVAEQVNEAAKQLRCDTVVMGARGLGNFGGLLLGLVANRVLHEVSAPGGAGEVARAPLWHKQGRGGTVQLSHVTPR